MIAHVAGVTYTYPGAVQPALERVDLTIPEGARILLSGPSAGGKSTLLRLLNGLIPQFHGGVVAGSVTVGGLDTAATPTRNLATVAGMVFQEPEAQGIADTVEDEIAFGMEQQGVPPAMMRRRIDSLLGAIGIESLRHRRLATLSGGERQRVAIAAVLALQPRLLLLDEPTSQLDPAGAHAVLDAIEAVHRDAGLAVVVAEHRLERLLGWAHIVLIAEDRCVSASAPHEVAPRLSSPPGIVEAALRLGICPTPLSIEGLRAYAPRLHPRPAHEHHPPAGDVLARTESLTVSLGDQVALRDVDLEVRQGEIIALTGSNGSGKTTLQRTLAGLVRPLSGACWLRGAAGGAPVQERTAIAGMVPQDPSLAFYLESLREEVAATLRHRRAGADADTVLARWAISDLAHRHPRSLSVGQQQRAAVTAMLAHEPPVWLLDEPTRGADGDTRAWLARNLREHARRGGAAIVATHDIEAAARFSTRAVGLRDGAIAFDLPAAQAFGTGGPLQTSIAAAVPGAILPEDLAWA